jgi:hypothetical protein
MAREGLTPKQEAFAQGVADGLSLAEAFRRANPSAAKWKPETIWVRASQWMASDKVATRVEKLKAALAEKALWTREDSVRTLIEVINDPDRKADVIAATKELNAMHGFDAPKKIEHGGNVGGVLVINIGGQSLGPDELGW